MDGFEFVTPAPPRAPRLELDDRSFVATAVRALVIATAAALTVLLAACGDSADETFESPATFDFADDEQDWASGFADLPAVDVENESYDLDSGWGLLPSELGGSGVFSAGTNRSDDLFMYWKRELRGLEPDTVYSLTFDLTVATNVPGGLVGIGGSPGESVFIKAGASTIEPETVEDEAGWLRMNIDVGVQAEGGDDAIVVGTVANENLPEDADGTQFARMELSSEFIEFTARTDGDGALWLIVGTDSGFEGRTEIWYDVVVTGAEAE